MARSRSIQKNPPTSMSCWVKQLIRTATRSFSSFGESLAPAILAKVRCKANRRIRNNEQQIEKLTFKLFGQMTQLPHQKFLSGSASLRLRLPNVSMDTHSKQFPLKTTDTVSKKHKLQRTIQGWPQ